MLFYSHHFLIFFFPLTLIFYYTFVLNKIEIKKIKIDRISILIVLSLLFYAYWSTTFLSLFVFSIFCNYFFYKINYEKKFYILVLSIIFNLLILFYFKYFNFFIENFNSIFGMNTSTLDVILPIGISFYTFQQIGFQIDKFNNTKKISFKKYFFFVSFFPQLIAGPILKFDELKNQIDIFENKKIKYFLLFGFLIFLIGIFKKIIIADNIGYLIVDPIYENFNQLDFFTAWFFSIFFLFQIYFDFSGYTDMAIGLALMLGFTLPQNFKSPLKSKSILEFWNNWHITMTRFFRDYLFFSISLFLLRYFQNSSYLKFVNKNIPIVFAYLLVFSLIGLWHGAGWNFILFGLLNGLLLGLNQIWRGMPFYSKIKSENIYKNLCFYITILSVILVFAIFRLENIEQVFKIYFNIFSFSQLFILDNYNFEVLIKIFILISIFIFLNVTKNTEEIVTYLNNKFSDLKNWNKIAIISFFLIILFSVIFKLYDINNSIGTFIYFQF